MESTPIRLVTQDELRAGAKRILARRRGALVASWGGFVAAGLATLIVPAGVLFFGVLWLSATMISGAAPSRTLAIARRCLTPAGGRRAGGGASFSVGGALRCRTTIRSWGEWPV
jgi:hypothetical protein